MSTRTRWSSPEGLLSIEAHVPSEEAPDAAWAASLEGLPSSESELQRAESIARGVLSDSSSPAVIKHLAENVLIAVARCREYVQKGHAGLAVTQAFMVANSLHALEFVLTERTLGVGLEVQERMRSAAQAQRKADESRVSAWQSLAREYRQRHHKRVSQREVAAHIAELERRKFGDDAASEHTIRRALKKLDQPIA